MTIKSSTWYIVDDQVSLVTAFASAFSNAALSTSNAHYVWKTLQAGQARTTIQSAKKGAIAGALIDIDLSTDPSALGTGLGLAQDLRAEQKKGKVDDFPLVRFANPNPVQEYVGRDPTSDDLFDLKISKRAAVQSPAISAQQCLSAREVYDVLKKARSKRTSIDLFGIDEDQFAKWGDSRFNQRLEVGLDTALHVGAGLFLRSFLIPNGILIDESLLAVRLGIDRQNSKSAWARILTWAERAIYRGVGHEGFRRWWAKGIEELAWELSAERFLHELTLDERVKALKKNLSLGKVVPLVMPSESEGNKPWRLCTLSAESDISMPVDPRHAEQLISSGSRDPWLEPELVAKGVAAMANSSEKRRIRRAPK